MEDRKIKILCVEDEKEIRENIAEILRDEGFEVFEAENGKKGYESFVQNKPDLVVSDIMMPEIDGYSLLKMIREGKSIRNNNIPFIFLSALGQKENIMKGVDLLANDYLIKPVDFDLMISKIREKTVNAKRNSEQNNRHINNIKEQISSLLPKDLYNYLNVIAQTADTLRKEPYGAFPHRRYEEDINKIYINAMKAYATIYNALDDSVIDSRVNVEQEIFSIYDFVNDFVSSLNDKYKNRISIEISDEDKTLSKIKADKTVFLDALKKIFAGIFKSDNQALVQISIMMDHLNQLAVIFYLKSSNPNFAANFDESTIGKILDKQNLRFEIPSNEQNTAILIIPSYRLVS